MGAKTYRTMIINFPILISIILIGFSGCRSHEKAKGPVINYCRMEENSLQIELNRTNGRIGNVHSLEVGKNGDALQKTDIKENNENVVVIEMGLIKGNNWFEDYVEGEHYEINVDWYSGRLNADSIYRNGNFEIVSEYYSSKI